jgi:hypothetical protein
MGMISPTEFAAAPQYWAPTPLAAAPGAPILQSSRPSLVASAKALEGIGLKPSNEDF